MRRLVFSKKVKVNVRERFEVFKVISLIMVSSWGIIAEGSSFVFWYIIGFIISAGTAVRFSAF
jgi:hypothetical protein